MQNQSSDNAYFLVSHEMITVLKWLMDHDIEGLKKLIKKALRNGLADELNAVASTHNKQHENPQELQQHVVDFFHILEALVSQAHDEDEVTNVVQQALMPALKHVDPHDCDAHTLAVSAAKATQAAEDDRGNPQEILFKELLKRWKPVKKSPLH